MNATLQLPSYAHLSLLFVKRDGVAASLFSVLVQWLQWGVTFSQVVWLIGC
jgi:hypothetical protein